MKVSILCSNEEHPVNDHLAHWISRNQNAHDIKLVRAKRELTGGDVLFLISCSEIVERHIRSAYTKTLVLHASALPKGRGWSPHIWEIIQGARELTISLLEAEDAPDTGKLWTQREISVPSDLIWNEINDLLFSAEMELMSFALENFGMIQPQAQDATAQPTYYRRRTIEDSEVDPEGSIASQFDLIRICDAERFPAFFKLRGCRYKLTVEKIDD